MEPERMFKYNFFFWKIFGLWPGNSSNKTYKYYSFFYLLITLGIYNILLTLNLIYAPRTIENMIWEVTFYFTEIVVTAKVLTIVLMRQTIIKSFAILDSNSFKGHDETSDKILERHRSIYVKSWKYYAGLSNFAFFIQILPPIAAHCIFNGHIELPICNYHFLSNNIRQKFFVFWFIYQVTGMYGHMMYNVNIDSFISGLMYLGIGQFKSLNHMIINLNKSGKQGCPNSDTESKVEAEKQMNNLKNCLKRYDMLLEYCGNLQKIFSVTMFFQFGISSAIICVILCGLTLDLKTETYIFMILYLMAMTMQIFFPGWLGTQLTIESQEISSAIYHSQWIQTSEPYKKNLLVLMERTKRPVILSGLDIFPLSLNTFISVMKTAYSFFTFLRNFQTH